MNCEIGPVLSKLIKRADIKMHVTCWTHQDERAVRLVESGYGIAITPAHIATSSSLRIALSEPDLARVVRLEKAKGASASIIDQVISLARSATWQR
jgi:hypothetical protein